MDPDPHGSGIFAWIRNSENSELDPDSEQIIADPHCFKHRVRAEAVELEPDAPFLATVLKYLLSWCINESRACDERPYHVTSGCQWHQSVFRIQIRIRRASGCRSVFEYGSGSRYRYLINIKQNVKLPNIGNCCQTTLLQSHNLYFYVMPKI